MTSLRPATPWTPDEAFPRATAQSPLPSPGSSRASTQGPQSTAATTDDREWPDTSSLARGRMPSASIATHAQPAESLRAEAGLTIRGDDRSAAWSPHQPADSRWQERDSSAARRPDSEAQAAYSESIRFGARSTGNRKTHSRAERRPEPAGRGLWPVDPDIAAMRNELKSLRLMLADRHADDERAAWSARHPLAAEIVARLIDTGFDENIARGLAASVTEGEDFATAWGGVRRRLAAMLPSGGSERLDQGGVVAIVGPNGAGKTTMLGRLALRRVERHGVDSITLVTIDHERFGAGQQLQSFAALARVPLWQERDAKALARRMAERLTQSPHHLFLLDTPGMTPSAMALGHPVHNLAAEWRDACARTERRGHDLNQAPYASPADIAAGPKGSVDWTNWLAVRASLDQRALKELFAAVETWPPQATPEAALLTHVDELRAWGSACSAVLENQLPIAFLGEGARFSEPLGRVDGDWISGLLLGSASQNDKPRPDVRASASDAHVYRERQPMATPSLRPLRDRWQPSGRQNSTPDEPTSRESRSRENRSVEAEQQLSSDIGSATISPRRSTAFGSVPESTGRLSPQVRDDEFDALDGLGVAPRDDRTREVTRQSDSSPDHGLDPLVKTSLDCSWLRRSRSTKKNLAARRGAFA
ncbi:MAG: hypothetical protein ACK4IT_01480 [Thioalkalivibrionaceae bacterium]